MGSTENAWARWPGGSTQSQKSLFSCEPRNAEVATRLLRWASRQIELCCISPAPLTVARRRAGDSTAIVAERNPARQRAQPRSTSQMQGTVVAEVAGPRDEMRQAKASPPPTQ